MLYLQLVSEKRKNIYVHILLYNRLDVKRNAKKMYLEHFCLLILAEWSAVFNTSSGSEGFKKIVSIFLIK